MEESKTSEAVICNNATKKSRSKKKKIKKIEPFYDSDEGIAWGPVTLKEIKGDLKRARAKINRRHTSTLVLQKKLDTETSNIPEIQVEKNIMDQNNSQVKDDSIPEISAYLTASVPPNNSRNSTSSSNYVSVLEPNASCKSSEYFSANDMDKHPQNNFETTSMNFVQKALNMTRDDIENEYQSLAGDTIFDSDDSNASLSQNDAVVLISSESDGETLSHLVPKEENISKSETSKYSKSGNDSNYVILTSSDEEEDDDILVLNEDKLSCVEEVSNEKSCSFSEKDCSRVEETYDIPSFCDQNIDRYLQNNSKNRDSLEYSKSPRNVSSAMTIPEIDLHQFNESSDSLLNTTLDRITAILKQGEDLLVSESFANNSKTDDDRKSNLEKIIDSHEDMKCEKESSTTSCNIISASFLHKPLIDSQIQVETRKTPIIRKATPIKSPRVTPASLKKTPTPISHIPILKKSPDGFRIPDLPLKPKISSKSKMNLKNIVSPVRMYIKYSPQAVLKQNVHSVEKQKLHVSSAAFESKNKENLPSLPNIRYKPSKTQIMATSQSVHLPTSVNKMVKHSAVIKHERIQKSQTKLIFDETLDCEAELTKSLLSESSGYNEVDISILHKRDALKE